MKLTQFLKHYDTEQKCIDFFRSNREHKGISCIKCKSKSLRWINTRRCWTCNACSYRLGLRKCTVMENSKLSYRLWLTCLYLMVLTKKGFSATEMQCLLEHKRYEPIWLMMHKIRIQMGQRDNQYQLDGFIELDEAFFAGHRKVGLNDKGKPYKEIDRNEKVLVAVSTEKTHSKFLKMTVVESLSKKDILFEVPKMITNSATVITDGRRCYTPIMDIAKEHQIKIIKDKKQVCEAFPWVHIAISNAKKKIKGIHHHVKNEYMQNYLDEFCYKYNRRFFKHLTFDKLIMAVLSASWFNMV
jgi:ISXO2-like transposase domain